MPVSPVGSGVQGSPSASPWLREEQGRNMESVFYITAMSPTPRASPQARSLSLHRVFFRAGALAQLEDQRDEKTTDTISKFQAHCRGYIARQNLKKIKVQELAIRCIQRNVKIYMAVRNWPWFRLVTKVLPLLNVHRTEDELKEKLSSVPFLKVEWVRHPFFSSPQPESNSKKEAVFVLLQEEKFQPIRVM
ncbi:TRAFAC class myosin-kinesin ATPase super [Branchiostoma belcheri]|nr:TRAFAC class myosin-kinesin ATPase super [Branchiostoma belcheri]